MTNLKFLQSVPLYSCLVVLILAFTVIFQSITTSANAGVPILYSCPSPGNLDDDNLYIVNPATGATLDSETITGILDVKGCNGLARDPTTGTCWIMINVSGGTEDPVPSGRILATIDESTGVATQVGIPGIAFASIAFDLSGTLFGVTGDGATTSETLYMLSKSDATPTLFQTLGNGIDGEAIAFNPDDGLMYHMSGRDSINELDPADGKRFETINLGDMTVTNIPLSSTDDFAEEEVTALVYAGGNTFLYGDIIEDLWSVTTSGVEVNIGDMDHRTKGLAFDCGVEPPECEVDGDCEPSGDVCAPNICESNVCVPDQIPDCCAAASDCADEDECTIDECESPGVEGGCAEPVFDEEDDFCFCRENPDDIDRGCAEAPIETGPVVIIPTMGQWGMIIATIFLGIFAVMALRRRTES